MKTNLEDEILTLNVIQEESKVFENGLNAGLIILSDDSKETKKKYNDYVRAKRKNFRKAILKCKLDCLYIKVIMILSKYKIIPQQTIVKNNLSKYGDTICIDRNVYPYNGDIFGQDYQCDPIHIDLDKEFKYPNSMEVLNLVDNLLEETNEEKAEVLKVILRGLDRREKLKEKIKSMTGIQEYKLGITRKIMELGGTL